MCSPEAIAACNSNVPLDAGISTILLIIAVVCLFVAGNDNKGAKYFAVSTLMLSVVTAFKYV